MLKLTKEDFAKSLNHYEIKFIDHHHRLIKKYTIPQVILYCALGVLIVLGVVSVINILPSVVDLPNQWPSISEFIHKVILSVEDKLIIISDRIYIIIGEKEYIETVIQEHDAAEARAVDIAAIVSQIISFYLHSFHQDNFYSDFLYYTKLYN